jgi:glutathionylspermidine synthase
MIRHRSEPRKGWEETVRGQGLLWHTDGETSPYWDESVCYELSPGEIARLELTAGELHALYIDTTERVIRDKRWKDLCIAEEHVPMIVRAWEEEEFTLYGRFDMVFDVYGKPRLLEYNADTPTALLEAAVVQWFWLKDTRPGRDQFNALHERLVAAWERFGARAVHFASIADAWEDEMTVAYLEETCRQAGCDTVRMPLPAIGWDDNLQHFIDEQDRIMETCFKLYPWEWMLRDEFARHIRAGKCRFLEPPWKLLWSNKAMLALMWEYHMEHPALLQCYGAPGLLGDTFVKKPVFSREGANVEIHRAGQIEASESGPYGSEGFIYQELAGNEAIDGHWPVLGVWMVDGECAGLGIREDSRRITGNRSRFVPHFIGD